MAIRILLADDHKMMREGFRALIEKQSGMTVIAEAGDGQSAVNLATKLKPDIVIMDIAMPGINGIAATRQIVAAGAGSKIIALSIHSERRFVREMTKAGASGYVLKDCAFEEMIHAIRTVAAGGVYLSSEIPATVLKDPAQQCPKIELSRLSDLTAREREVLQLLAEGSTTKEIAAKLQFSPKTAEFHRQRIMQKLNIRNLVDLTKFAIREGLTSC
jgi:DNA-binding NarL/FixJ family response regulator